MREDHLHCDDDHCRAPGIPGCPYSEPPRQHWKHRATRCAVPGCEATRKKGWTTCTRQSHYERGVSLYGLAPKAPKLKNKA